MTMKLRVVCLLGICFAPGAWADAELGATLTERDYFDELPVVLSVSRLAQPLNETPGAVTVIDRDMIRRSGARQFVDLLRLVPGFQVAYVPYGQPAATYHGLGASFSQHLQVLVDGRSQYSPFFLGGVNWDLVPVSLDDIERVEVMRGSNSAAYGSNAFLGVVNIVTRHASETVGASAETRSGQQGVSDQRIRVGAGNGGLYFRATAESTRDSGYPTLKDDKRQQLFDLRADWRIGLRDELQFQAGQRVTDFETGSPDSAANPARNERLSQRFVSLGWRRNLDVGEDLFVRVYRTEERGVDGFSGFDTKNAPFVDPITVDYGYRSVRNNLEATHTVGIGGDGRIVWGGEFRTDSVNGPIWFGRRDDVALSVARAFGNLEWRLRPEVVANAGGTWERDSNSKTTFAPRVSVNWHVSPEQTLRFGVARAYRAPSLYEARGNSAFVTTGGLVTRRHLLADGSPILPEQVTSREIGWLGEFRSLGLTGDLRIFEERVSDRILALETILPPPYCNFARPFSCAALRAYNAEDLTIRGLEYQWRWQPARDTRIILNQAFVRILPQVTLPADGRFPVPLVPGLANSPQSPIGARELLMAEQSAPTRNSTVMLMQRLPGGFDLSAIWSSVGAMRWTTNGYVNGWHRLDWRLSYEFRIGPTKGEVVFTVQNDGKPHAEYQPDTPSSPRGYVSLSLQY